MNQQDKLAYSFPSNREKSRKLILEFLRSSLHFYLCKLLQIPHINPSLIKIDYGKCTF